MGRRSIVKYLNPWMFRRDRERGRFQAVRARDGDNCWRCHRPMDFSEPRNKKRSATVEHRVPRALGGTWALKNLVLCHVGCNRHLGANTPEQKERMRLRKEQADSGSRPG